MSVIATIAFRPSEMVNYDDNYRVWNGKWGFNNIGSDPMQIDPNTGAIIAPETGHYRMTGVLMGQASSAGLIQAFVNLPPDQLKAQGQDPSYPFPFYFGSRQVASPGFLTMPFCGTIGTGPGAPFSFYFSNNFNPDDPYARLLVELIS